MRSGWSVVAGMVTALACGHGSSSTPAPRAVVADTVARGVVRVVGAEPLTQVILRVSDTGPTVGIVGSLRREIGSLEGVEVAVSGPAVPNQPPPPARAVDAKRYEILAVGGVPAHVGVIARRSEAYVLVGERDTLELLAPVPPSVAALTGVKVFIVGAVEAGKLHVQGFGRIGHP